MMGRFLSRIPAIVRIALAAAAVVTALWLLYPARTVEASAKDVTEIHFMGPGGPLTGVLENAVRMFEQESREAHAKDPSHPQYRVVSGQNASRDMTSDPTRFLLSVAGGMPPDVIYFDRFAVAEWASRGAFLNLDPYLERERGASDGDVVRRDDYYSQTWNEVVYRDPRTGKTGTYGVPDAFESRALIYNKDLLRKAGYVDAHGEVRPPKTWDDLQEMAVRLTEWDDKGRITRLGFAPFSGQAVLYQYGWQNGGDILSADGRTVTIDSPEFIEALDWTTKIYDSIGGVREVKAFESTGQTADLDPFIAGRVAIKFEGFWTTQYALAEYGDRVDYGVAAPPMPAGALAAGRRPLGWLGGWCYAIPATARQPEAAWKLIRFLTSPRVRRMMTEGNLRVSQSLGRPFVPAQSAHRLINEENFRKYVESDPFLDQKLKEAIRVFNSLVEDSKYRPATPVGQMLFSESLAATEAANYGAISAADALRRVAVNTQAELDRTLGSNRGAEVQWKPLLVLFGVILVLGVIAIYFWDTRPRLRAAVWKWSGLALLAGRKKGDAPSAGAQGFRTNLVGGVLCALPWIIGFVVFTSGPIFFSIVISFTEYDVLHPATWNGLENFRRLLGQDHLLGVAVMNTLFMMLGLPLGMAAGLGIALLLNVEVRGIALWRTCFYLPSIVPAVASSILWIWIFNPQAGLLNSILASVGIQGPNWLQDPNTSKPALILMGLWGAGGGMIVWLAGLKGISKSYYEAACIDGASTWRQFTSITLPLLTPYIFFNLIMGVIGTLQIFSQAFIMTQGGPVNSTLFYAYHLFNHAFRYLNMGYASAMAWALVVVVLILTAVQMKLAKKWVHYEGD
jgi:multiple sugar transport system permease protein